MKTEPIAPKPVFGSDLLHTVPDGPSDAVRLMDRGAPNWARYLSYVFSIASALCLMGLVVIVVFLQSLVAQKGEVFAVPLLLAMAAVPAFGALLLDYAHNRALAGLRHARGHAAQVGRMAVAVFMFILMTLAHPLLGVAIPTTCIVAFLVLVVLEKGLRREPSWDFRKEEAVGLLSGRDEIGRRLAQETPSRHALTQSVLRVARWGALVGGVATASYLAASEIVSYAAVAAVGIISYWGTEQILQVLANRLRAASDKQAEPDLPTAGAPGGLGLGTLSASGLAAEEHLFEFEMRRYAVLLGGVAGVIVLLYAALFLRGWFFALRNDRKSCKVRADLLIGLEMIDGYITILGQRGCRFQPINVGALNRVRDLARVLPADVQVQVPGHELNGAIHALKEDTCAVFFESYLSGAVRADILNRSLVAAKTTPRRRVDPRAISSGTVTLSELDMPDVPTEFDAPDLSELANYLGDTSRAK